MDNTIRPFAAFLHEKHHCKYLQKGELNMALPKVARYVNNVGKSMVYASMDVIKEDMPTISAMVTHDSNKEVYKAIYAGIRDYRITFTRATRYVKSSKIYKAADLAVKSAAEDLASGKWYNAERSKKLEEAAVEAMGGFGEDEDWDFGEESDSGTSTEVSKGDKLIAAATEVSSHKAASMVSSTILATSKAQIEATQASTNFLYAQNAKLMGELRSDVVNTGARAIQEQTKTNTILENLATNSQKFFENTSKQLQELVAIQKEAVEMQRNLYGDARANQQNKKNDNKVSFDDLLTTDGVLDLKAYGKSIKRNTMNLISEKSGGMFDSLMQEMGDKSMLELFAANPLGMMTTGLLRGTMSKQLQSSLKRLDKTLAGTMGTMISRMNNMAKNEEGNIFSQLFGRVFGFNVKEKSTIDVGKFTKGPVPFDGITRATINNAIPVYLARIESALTGNAPRVYNAYTGRWQTSSQLGDEFKNMKQQAINSGTSDIAAELVKQMLNNKKYRAGSIEDREKIVDNINKFLEALYKRGGDFKLKSWDDWYELGVDGEDMLRMIMGAYRGMPRHKRLQAAQQVMDSKNAYTKRLERLEEEGSIYANIFSGAYDKKQLYTDTKKGYVEEAKSGLANTLSLAKDNKGKDIWYYLQNMYTELYRVRQAIGGGSGIPTGLYGTGRQYRELASPITDTHEKTNRDKYIANRQNQRVRYNEDLQKFIDEGGKEIDIQDGETMRRVFLNMSAEDREKAKRDLDNSSNFFQRALYNNQWDLDGVNAEREKHNKSKLKGKFLEVFKEATLDEKLKMAGNYLSRLTSKPNEWAVKMVEAADKRIYDLFYGQETGKEDEKGNKIRGMMNLMTFKFNQTLNNMTTWTEEHIFNPIKKKLGIESFSDILDKIGITQLFEGITNKVLGEKGPNGREGGFLSDFGKKFSDAITEKAKGADDWFKNAFSNVFGPLKSKLGLGQGGPIFNNEQEFDITGYDTSSITGQTTTASNTGVLADKYAKVMKSFSRDALKTSKTYRDKFAGGAASSMVRNGTSLSVDSYFHFRKNILKMIKGIILSFNEFPMFIEEMNTGKNKAGFDPNALANAPLNVLPKLFNMMLDTLRTAKPVNFIPLEQYNAAYRLAGLGMNSPIGRFVNAKEKAITTIEVFLRDQNTQNMFKAEGGSEELKNLLNRLKQIKSDGNEEKKSLADRLADYKARKAAGDPSIKAITRRSVLGNSKYSDQATKVVTEANSVMAKQKQTDDEKLQVDIDKLHKKLVKSFGLSGDVSRNLLSLLMELAFNRNIRDLEKVLAGDLYNYAIDYGYTDLAMAIDKAMITKYNNTQADLGSLASATTVKPKPKDGIFNRATEILEKIYNLLLINMGSDIPRDFTSQDTANILKSYDRRNAIFLGQRTRGRESRTQSGEDSHSDEPPGAHAFGGFFKNRGLSALSKGEIYGRGGLYGKVPKTGVYDVKAGTTIYPTKSGDKAIELAKEQKAIEDFIKSNATGQNANTKVIDGKAYTQITNDAGESIWVRKGSDGKWYKLDETTLVERIGNTARRGANAVVDAYNTSQRNLNREHQIKINGTNPKAIAKDIQKNIPGISASAALGAAAGLLFGNPLLGAAIGGSVATVQVSETAKNMLFGKEITDEAGNKSRSGGFISKGAQDTFKKYFPSMSQHAAVGATLGLLTPFGLVGGALLGSAAGFVQKNEAANIALFGTPDDENSGIISKKSRDKLKKIAPNLFVGAGAAALLGPFGLVGNIALGAGLGMASTTDEFQNAILGEEVEIAGVKTRVGGLVGTLNTEVITPLKDWGKNFAEDTANFFKDKVLSPLSEAFTPIITEIGHVGKGAIRLIPKTIDMVTDMLGGTPLGATFAKMVQAPRALLGMGAKAATTVAKGTILAPVTAISALGRGLKNKQIRGGYANYMTAQERLDYRQSHERTGFAQGFLGNRFGGRSDTYSDIDATMAQADKEGIDYAAKTAKILLSAKDFKKDIRSKRRTIKAVLIEFFETKYYKKMERLVDKDRFSDLLKAIQNTPSRQGVTDKQKQDIMELIKSLQDDIRLFHDKSARTKEAKQQALADLNKAGFKGINEKNIGKFYESLQHEQSARKATEVSVNPEQAHMEDTVTTAAASINATLKEIYEGLDKTIKEILGVEEKQLEAEATGDHAEALEDIARNKENNAKDSNDTKEANEARTEANKKKNKATRAKNNAEYINQLSGIEGMNVDPTATPIGSRILSDVEAMSVPEEYASVDGTRFKGGIRSKLAQMKMARDQKKRLLAARVAHLTGIEAMRFDDDTPGVSGRDLRYSGRRVRASRRMMRDMETERKRQDFYDRVHSNAFTFDEDSNSMVDLKGIKGAFHGRMDEKGSTDKERIYYDSDSNSVRVFRKTLHGWKEVAGKAKNDADKQEDQDDEKKMSKFAKLLSRFRNKGEDEGDGKNKKEGGIFSKIKSFFGKGLGLLAKIGLGITGAAAMGHGYEFAKTTLVPGLKSWWEETASPWLDAHLGDRLRGIKDSVVDFATHIPEKIQSVFEWMNKNRDKVMKWYTDGLQAFGGMIQEGVHFIVSNLPAIFKGLFSNVLIPAFKGMISGLGDIFNKKRDGLKYRYPESSTIISGNSKRVNVGIAAMRRLGMDISGMNESSANINTSSFKDSGIVGDNDSSPVDTSNNKNIIADAGKSQSGIIQRADDNLKYKVQQATQAAYDGQREDYDGNLVNYYDNNLMAKTEAGDTLVLDDEGNVIDTQDQSGKLNYGKFLAGRFAKAAITGRAGVAGATLKYGGKAIGLAGKVVSFIGKGIGKVSKLVGGATNVAGKVTQGVGKVSETGGKVMNWLGKSNKVANAGTKAADLIAEIGIKLSEVLGNVLKNDKVSKLIGSIAEKFGKSGVTGSTLSGMLDDMIEKLIKGVEKLLKPILNEGAENALGKATKILGKVAFWVTVGTAVKDFVMGWTDADTILGIVKDATDFKLTGFHKFLCGTINAINGFLLGLIPTENLVDYVMDTILPFFKVEDTALQKAREESQEYLDVLKAETGTDYDVRSYNSKDKWYTKLKNKTSNWWSGVKSSFGKGSQITEPMDTSDKGSTKSVIPSASALKSKALASANRSQAEANKLYGMGRAYQRDPSVANIQFNRSGDSRRQTIGDSGCGPAAAVNAVNYAYGTGNSLISAAKTAINYKEKDGGTRPEFFNSYFKSQGLSSTRLSGPSEIERNIRRGNPTVLMGKDPRGGAATPYGPNPHYVTAKGFDARGHIIIDDPESPSGSVAYDKNKVLGKTTVAVGASRFGRGKWGMAAQPAPGDIQGTKEVMWSFLLSKGYSENSAAAIMGNWGQECSFNYSLVQKGASNPGLGIAQWTYKTRKNAFLNAVPDWKTNLMGQLNFFWNEVNSSYPRVKPDKLNTITDLYAAVREFHDVYEQSADKTMDNRNRYAAAVYQEFTGSAPVALPSGGTSSAFSSQVANNLDLSSGQNTVMGQLGEKVGNLVKSALALEYGDTRLGAIFGSNISSSSSNGGIDQALQMGTNSGVISGPTTSSTAAPSVSTSTTTSTTGNDSLAQAVQMGTNSGVFASDKEIYSDLLHSGMGSGNYAKYGMGVGGLYTVQITAVFDGSGKRTDINPPKETSGSKVGGALDTSTGQTIRVVYKYKDKAGDKAGHTGYISQGLANELGLFNANKSTNMVASIANTARATLASSTPTRQLNGVEKVKSGFALIYYKNTPYINLSDANAKQALNTCQRASGKAITEKDSKKQIWWIVKNYWGIDLEAMAKFAKDIAVYKDNTIGQLKKDKNDLYTQLQQYAVQAKANIKSQADFEKLTVGYFCEKVFGLKFDGESVAVPSGDGTTAGGATDSGMTGFDTASGVSTEASATSMGSIFDMFKAAFASAFDYTDSQGNKQNLLSLLGLGGTSSSTGGSSNATTATGGAITGASTGVQGAMANGFPYYNQSDPAWGSVPYGKEGTISSSGCGPTSMAMVAKSYGANVTPEDTMKWSLNNGHRVYGAGTAWDFFRAYGNSIGVQTEQAGPSSNFMTNKLRSGVPIISSMRKGHFTKGGHFIVLSGIDEQGNILVNDPSSTERTGQKWSPDIVAGESKQMWAVSRDGKGSIGSLSQNTSDKISEQGLAGSLANSAQQAVSGNQLMGMGSGNYAKYGRGVTPAQVDYSQILKAMAMSLEQLVENTSLLAQIIQILTSGKFGNGSGISAEQAAAIANASAQSASSMRDKMNNMLNLSSKNMGNIASGRDANNIIQTMTQIASQ